MSAVFRPLHIMTAAALALLLIVVATVLSRSPKPASSPPPGGFKVANVRSLGQPAAAMVLEPDPGTVIVIVD